MVGRGEESVRGFLNPLKGKVAELRIVPVLEERYSGYNFELAPDPTQPVWDLHGRGPEGTDDIYIQVKTGGADYADDVIGRMEAAPENVLFAVSRDIHERIGQLRPELLDRVIDNPITNQELTEGVEESVERLARNHGIDVPDSVGEILPFVAEIYLGVKVIYDIVSVERDFKDVELTDRKRVHALKPESTEGRPWGQPLKKPAGAPLNLG